MKTKSNRWTSSNSETQTLPDASLPPHMQHLKPKRRERTERQRARKAVAVGEARRNGTVALVRSLTTPQRKRGAAKYGPAPKNPPHPGMQSPKPMPTSKRAAAYQRQNGSLLHTTGRQRKRLNRMSLRAAWRNAKEASHG